MYMYLYTYTYSIFTTMSILATLYNTSWLTFGLFIYLCINIFIFYVVYLSFSPNIASLPIHNLMPTLHLFFIFTTNSDILILTILNTYYNSNCYKHKQWQYDIVVCCSFIKWNFLECFIVWIYDLFHIVSVVVDRYIMGKPGFKQGDGFSYQFRYQKMVFHGLRSNSMKLASFKGGGYVGKRHTWFRNHFSSIVFTVALMGFLLYLDSLLGSIFEPTILQRNSTPVNLSSDMVRVYVFFYVLFRIESWYVVYINMSFLGLWLVYLETSYKNIVNICLFSICTVLLLLTNALSIDCVLEVWRWWWQKRSADVWSTCKHGF